MFEWMAKQNFDWHGIDLFWVDERCVPIDDSQSNYRMTRESLLDHVPLAPGQIHRVKTEHIPEEAAVEYIDDISRTFRLQPGELPVFDVLQRGMGPDRHTASLFPGEPLIENKTGIASVVWAKSSNSIALRYCRAFLKKRATHCALSPARTKPRALSRCFTASAIRFTCLRRSRRPT